jgi:hypothetical protein
LSSVVESKETDETGDLENEIQQQGHCGVQRERLDGRHVGQGT